jgi:hypothetical protein
LKNLHYNANVQWRLLLIFAMLACGCSSVPVNIEVNGTTDDSESDVRYDISSNDSKGAGLSLPSHTYCVLQHKEWRIVFTDDDVALLELSLDTQVTLLPKLPKIPEADDLLGLSSLLKWHMRGMAFELLPQVLASELRRNHADPRFSLLARSFLAGEVVFKGQSKDHHFVEVHMQLTKKGRAKLEAALKGK